MMEPTPQPEISKVVTGLNPNAEKLEVFTKNIVNYTCPKCHQQVAILFQNLHVCEVESIAGDKSTQKAVQTAVMAKKIFEEEVKTKSIECEYCYEKFKSQKNLTLHISACEYYKKKQKMKDVSQLPNQMRLLNLEIAAMKEKGQAGTYVHPFKEVPKPDS